LEIQLLHCRWLLKEPATMVQLNLQFSLPSKSSLILLTISGCKGDLIDKRQVTYNTAKVRQLHSISDQLLKAFCDSKGVHYIEISSKLNINVERLMAWVTKEMLDSVKEQPPTTNQPRSPHTKCVVM
jgi:hypothetical protein